MIPNSGRCSTVPSGWRISCAVICRPTPEIVDAFLVDDSLGDHQGDRMGRVWLRNGGDACVHVVIGHASSESPYMAFRLLPNRIQEREIAAPDAKPGGLTQIFTVVVYPGRALDRAPFQSAT